MQAKLPKLVCFFLLYEYERHYYIIRSAQNKAILLASDPMLVNI